MESKSIINVIANNVLRYPDRYAIIYLDKELREANKLSYAELWNIVLLKANILSQQYNVVDRILLLLPEGMEFITSFLACLVSRLIAIPANPPHTRKRHSDRILKIIKDCQPKAIITDSELVEDISHLLVSVESQHINFISHWQLTDKPIENGHFDQIQSNDIAFLQYTSGSTGNPKGVIISHSNIYHNEEMIQECFGHDDSKNILGWLPLFHDMGLIGNVLQPLFLGSTCILMSPLVFLQNPIKWFKAIDTYKISTTGGPNFAYNYCVQKIELDDCRKIDLSGWTVAFNGSEMVRANTMENFYQKFKSLGFEKKSFLPCYGMAEATLLVSGKKHSEYYKTLLINNPINDEKEIRKTSFLQKNEIVSCGKVYLDQQIVIIDINTHKECEGSNVGEVCILSKCTTKGYWNDVNADSKYGEYHRTGDLGFVHEGELYICGRRKEVIIIRGQNYYPFDIEETVQNSSPDLVKEGGAAFSTFDVIEEKEKLIIIQEVKRTSIKCVDFEILKHQINRTLSTLLGLVADSILFVKPSSIKKTTSGKIKRLEMRHLYEAGKIEFLK